jgi:hypothetical protein
VRQPACSSAHHSLYTSSGGTILSRASASGGRLQVATRQRIPQSTDSYPWTMWCRMPVIWFHGISGWAWRIDGET